MPDGETSKFLTRSTKNNHYDIDQNNAPTSGQLWQIIRVTTGKIGIAPACPSFVPGDEVKCQLDTAIDTVCYVGKFVIVCIKRIISIISLCCIKDINSFLT